MRILFSGGGTVGHISPAIAMAEELTSRSPDAEVLFAVREGGAENAVISKAGFPTEGIRITGLERRLTAANMRAIRLALAARSKAREILSDFRPDAVVGTGGYVCWPVLSAAHSMCIPTAVHESNAVLGLTSKMLSRRCDLLLLGQDIECRARRKIYVGNPIRRSFSATSRRAARARPPSPWWKMWGEIDN